MGRALAGIRQLTTVGYLLGLFCVSPVLCAVRCCVLPAGLYRAGSGQLELCARDRALGGSAGLWSAGTLYWALYCPLKTLLCILSKSLCVFSSISDSRVGKRINGEKEREYGYGRG